MEVREYINLIILLRRESTTEVLDNGLDSSVIEVNNCWSKIEMGWGGGEVLSMIVTYTQVDNELGLHLSY